MNTSHNKNRVIEHGWKNVFKNVFGNTSSIPPSNHNGNELSISKQCETENLSKPQNKDEDPMLGSHKSRRNLKKKDVLPESNGYVHNQQEATSIQEPGTSGSLVLCPSNLSIKDEKQAFALKLIQMMSEDINDEDRYLEYFKRLLSFEEDRKDDNFIQIVDLEVEIGFKQNKSMAKVAKNVTSKSKDKKSVLKTNKPKNNYSVNVEVDGKNKRDGNEKRKAPSGDLEHRIAMRTEIIDKLQTCYKKDVIYDSLINDLIDYEESFVR